MKPKLISLLVANLFLAAPVAFAQQGFVWSGSVSLGARGVNDKANDPSKLNEYRDLDSNGIGIFDVRGRGSDYYINAFGENLGNDDQYFDLWGGRYGVFKYQIYSNELRHRFGSPPMVRSPYSGIGTTTLIAPFPAAAGLAASPVIVPSTWNAFDSSIERRDLGGFFEWSATSPWYFRVDANEVKREGVRTISGAQGTSPGNGFVELPRPVDWTTTNFSVEGGYQSRRSNISLNVSHSKFENGNDVLRFSNGFLSPGAPLNLDSKPLEPTNELIKWSLNGNLKQLPWSSTLSGRLAWSKLTNDVAVLPTILFTASTNPATGASTPTFNGEIINKSASLSFSSQPMRALDTRLYYNWSEKENHNTLITFTSAALGCAAGCTPELFSYKKNNVGAEVGYRLNPNNRITGGVDYWDIERERIDFNETDDTKLFVQWKNHSFDTVDTRLKYQFLQRRSNFVSPSAEITANPMAANVRRFDLANVDQHLVKVGLDYSPRPLLDFGVEAIYKNNDYKDTLLGRTEDERQEFYASASFGDPNRFRVLLFGDVEYSWYDSRHRVGAVGGPDSAPAPAAPAVSTSYTWTAKNKDRSWQVGVGADWKPMERLKVASSLIHAHTVGSVDFAAQAGTVLAAPGLLPINNFDDTKRIAFNLKATYALDRRFDVTAGYAFERYRYNDIGYDGFGYVALGATATANAYFTGEQAFQNYNANILYLIATYKF